MKLFKRSSEKVFSESVVKAHLIGCGSGTLEVIDDTIRFYLEKGRFRKEQILEKEIPMSEVEEANLVGNELSVTWKGAHDIFVLENIESSDTFLGKVLRVSEEQEKPSKSEEAVAHLSNKKGKLIGAAMDITDLLFDILRGLNGWVDWDRIEKMLKKSLIKIEELLDRKISFVDLDFSKLSMAIKERVHEEVSKEIFSLLKLMYDYFVTEQSENQTLKGINQNDFDLKIAIQAYYILNDIVLGSVIGDEELVEEQEELLLTLEDLGKSANLKINIGAIKAIVCKLCDDKGKETLIKKSRKLFRSQIKNLITD
jgi:hypothetical protein